MIKTYLLLSAFAVFLEQKISDDNERDKYIESIVKEGIPLRGYLSNVQVNIYGCQIKIIKYYSRTCGTKFDDIMTTSSVTEFDLKYLGSPILSNQPDLQTILWVARSIAGRDELQPVITRYRNCIGTYSQEFSSSYHLDATNMSNVEQNVLILKSYQKSICR